MDKPPWLRLVSSYSQTVSFLAHLRRTVGSHVVLKDLLKPGVLRDVVPVHEVGVLDVELLDSPCQQVDVTETLLGQDLSHLGPSPLALHEDDDDLVIQVLEPLQGAEVIVAVNPGVREGSRAHYVVVVVLLLSVGSFPSHVNQNNVLLLESEKGLKRIFLREPLRL